VDRAEVDRAFGDPFLGRTVRVGSREYVLVAVVGRGSQSRVFRARPRTGGVATPVAVKLVRLDAPAESSEPASAVAERLRREIEVARSLSGVEGVPMCLGAVLGGVELPPFEAVAFEWIEAREPPRPLGLRDGAAWARPISSAHARGFVHGDLAPPHFGWGPHGARVFDWGCSVALGAAVVAGRRAFASPELAASLRADVAADWFAFGASLLRMGPLTSELRTLVERLVGPKDDRLAAAIELLVRGKVRG
jgi:serine/threonine protein kinase